MDGRIKGWKDKGMEWRDGREMERRRLSRESFSVCMFFRVSVRLFVRLSVYASRLLRRFFQCDRAVPVAGQCWSSPSWTNCCPVCG